MTKLARYLVLFILVFRGVSSFSQVTASGGILLCEGSSATLSASGSINYSWSTGATGNTIVVGPGTTTSYTVTGTDGSGFTGTAVVTVTVLPSPILSISGNNTICAGTAFVLNVSGANAYTWSAGATGPVLTFTPTSNLTFTVTGVDLNGCSSETTASVFLMPTPTIVVAGDINVCPGGVITQTAYGAVTYTWSTGDVGTVLSLTPAITTTYAVKGTGSNGCEQYSVFNIAIKPVPQLSVNNPVVCAGTEATLVAQAVPATGVNYAWYPGALAGANITVMPPESQSYTLVANSLGCYTSQVAWVTVTPAENPVTAFFYPVVCQGNSLLAPIKSDGFNGGGQFSSATLGADPETGVIKLASQPPGLYKVQYQFTAKNCLTATLSIAEVSIAPGPGLLLTEDTHIIEGAAVALQADGGENYTWYPADYLSCSECPDPVAAPPKTTEYCVTSMLKSCLSKACVTILVGCEFAGDLSVPNAFTPNGDGINDEFCLQGWKDCISDFKITIFDRWGEMVFASDKPDFCWDGTNRGKQLDGEVVVYVISASGKKDNIHKKGTISLIR